MRPEEKNRHFFRRVIETLKAIAGLLKLMDVDF